MQLPTWPDYSAEEINIVSDVLKSGKVNYWTGSHGKAFETEYAAYCGVEFGVAVANGSVGLEAALYGLGVGPGDEVIVTPRSFIASASAISMTGATPVFADVDRDSQNITPQSVRASISDRTRAIICVHLAGWPCDMPGIMQVANEYGLAVIEDCAQAHGARVAGKPVGSWGDIGVFSFCQDKIISTGGEGGMLVTDRRDLFEKLWSYKDHGKNYAVINGGDHPSGFRWLHDSIGTNLRITEMQAALGRWQLKRLDASVEIRRQHAASLANNFSDIDCVRLATPDSNVLHSYYRFYIFIKPEKLKPDWNRDRVIAEFEANGIPGLSGSCPEIYLEKAFAKDSKHEIKRLANARELGETSIMFLVHPTLDARHIEFVAEQARQVLMQAQAN